MKFSSLYRILAVVLLLSCLLTLALPMAAAEETSADAGADTEYEAKKAAYRAQIMANDVTSDDLLIGSWVTFYSFDVDSYEFQLDQMAAAGLNFNIFPKNFGSGGMYDLAYWDDVEAQYAKRNMVYLMNGSMNTAHLTQGVEYADGKAHCIGYHVVDEPGGDALQSVANMVIAYRDADATRYPFVNLLPSYAGTSWLGGTYYEHVSRFVELAGAENIEYLSHDYYPFRAGNEVKTEIFADMEVLRKVAYENGKLKTHAFPQSTAWNGTRMPTENEMRWNVYGYLAYGFKALSWFNLVCPGSSDTEGEGFRDSLIYRDGTIRDPELYDFWSELNWEIRGLSDILMNVDVAHAYHTRNASGVEILPKDYFIQPTSQRSEFIISVMEPKDGGDAYVMIFNKTYKKDTTTAKFDIDLSGDVKWLEYFDPHTGEYTPVEIVDGVMEETFLAGEGRVYRLRTDAPPAEETEAPTEEPTEEPTEAPSAAVTEAPTEAPTETPSETEAPKSGCGSVLSVAAALPALLTAGVICASPKRRKEKRS